jgi:hypothetical protein
MIKEKAKQNSMTMMDKNPSSHQTNNQNSNRNRTRSNQTASSMVVPNNFNSLVGGGQGNEKQKAGKATKQSQSSAQ